MLCRMKSFRKANRDLYNSGYLQRQYRVKQERSNQLKIAVVGSGSFGDPSSLLIKTCDNFMYVYYDY